jgi:hypothetical protein
MCKPRRRDSRECTQASNEKTQQKQVPWNTSELNSCICILDSILTAFPPKVISKLIVEYLQEIVLWDKLSTCPNSDCVDVSPERVTVVKYSGPWINIFSAASLGTLGRTFWAFVIEEPSHVRCGISTKPGARVPSQMTFEFFPEPGSKIHLIYVRKTRHFYCILLTCDDIVEKQGNGVVPSAIDENELFPFVSLGYCPQTVTLLQSDVPPVWVTEPYLSDILELDPLSPL